MEPRGLNDIERPRVFIGSSSEGLEVARALQVLLDRSCEAEIWSQGLFEPGGFTLSSLIKAANRFDFAILVVSPDDMTTSRGAVKSTTRDNVVFELGLFMGAIGPDRTFMVYDRKTPPDLPTDLAGVTPASFEQHSSGNLMAALGAASTLIERNIREIGRLPEMMRKRGYVDAESGREALWRKRTLKLLVQAAESVDATCATGHDLMSLLRTSAWPHHFDGRLTKNKERGGAVLVAVEYGPHTFLAHNIDTLNGRLAEAAGDFAASAVLLVRPCEPSEDVRLRLDYFSPGVQWLTVDENTTEAVIAAKIKNILDVTPPYHFASSASTPTP
ncbi:UNVERIFIED_CONTAM: nucleotide-binding protein [Actinomycetes bacterium ARC8]|nr:nucleotide-binding protein [Actinomycetes bacterium ARC8]